MTDEHIEKTKAAIASAGNIPADRKAELLDLLSKLSQLLPRFRRLITRMPGASLVWWRLRPTKQLAPRRNRK